MMNNLIHRHQEEADSTSVSTSEAEECAWEDIKCVIEVSRKRERDTFQFIVGKYAPNTRPNAPS